MGTSLIQLVTAPGSAHACVYVCESHIHTIREGQSGVDMWSETVIISYSMYMKPTQIIYYKMINIRVNA